MKPRFLLDVDGVLADFSGGCLDVIEGLTGIRYTSENIDEWSITACQAFRRHHRPGFAADFWSGVSEPGFCAGIKPLPGARELVAALSAIGDVYAVTTPFDSPTWMREREEWLRDLGIPSSNVIFTHDKAIIRGTVLVDDKPAHVEAWAEANPDGTALLVDQPYNRSHVLERGRRIHNLSQILEGLT